MAVENGPVEDVFPIENWDFPASHVSLLECSWFQYSLLQPKEPPKGWRSQIIFRSSQYQLFGNQKGSFSFWKKRTERVMTGT